MKVVISTFSIISFIVILYVPHMPLTKVPCIQDLGHEYLQNHFEFFKSNPEIRNYILILFGALTDMLLIGFLLQWVHYGGTWRFVISLGLTYLLRLILTELFLLRQPEGGDLWVNPGWGSLTVQYGMRNDYYFNPVVAICLQLFLEYRQLDQHFLKWLCLVALTGNVYLTMSLRGHYLIDNYGGIIFGYQIWSMVNNFVTYWIDVRLFGMTFEQRFPLRKLCKGSRSASTGLYGQCSGCGTAINQWIGGGKPVGGVGEGADGEEGREREIEMTASEAARGRKRAVGAQ